MGWGCYKHEWDEGSEDWIAAYLKLAEEKLKESPLTWGRNGAICPACWVEQEAEIERLREELKMRDSRTYSEQLEWNEELSEETDRLNKRIEELESRAYVMPDAGIWITRGQVDAAVEIVEHDVHAGLWDVLNKIGIERCEGVPLGIVDGCEGKSCPRCLGHEWVIGGEDE